uniref:Cyclic nucleotide-binding domain-containing protein n=1 Tax=Corethrella appendiculata TaxID=1370023 RepID=W4VRF2_9DIPT
MDNRRAIHNVEAKEIKNFFSIDDGEDVIQKTYFKKPPMNSCFKSRSQQHSLCKSGKSGHRVRSASTGRDKKSELQARYWAFLFGNLQRSVNEIYQTVECYENLSSCQEAILVLENYIRDFKALAEWFKVSWDYEATPLPQRPNSLAWEVRKSNPTPRVRNRQLSSPAISGKSSPNFSGKNSPCSNIDDLRQNSPKKHFSSTESLNKKSKLNLSEAFSNVTLSKPETEIIIPPPKEPEIITLNEEYILKLDQYTQTNLDDENLTLAEYLEKYCQVEGEKKTELVNGFREDETSSDTTTLGTPESVIEIVDLKKVEIEEISTKIAEDSLKKVEESIKKIAEEPIVKKVEDPVKIEQPKKIISAIKYSSVVNNTTSVANKIAPKSTVNAKFIAPPARNVNTKNIKPTSSIIRKSSTTSQITNSGNKIVNLPAKSATVPHVAGINANKNLKASNSNKIPSNISNRLSTRAKTMIEINNRKTVNRNPIHSKLSNSRKASNDDVNSSTSTLKASNDHLSNVSNNNKRVNQITRKSEPKTLPSEANNDGWLTVKTKRRSSLHWATRFNQPSTSTSLPSLSLLNENPTCEENAEKEKNEEVTTKKEPEKTTNNNKKPVKPVKKPISSLATTESTQNKVSNKLNKITKNNIPPINNQSIKKTSPSSISNDGKRLVNSAPAAGRTKQNENLSVSRQKSDLTGLKLKTLHKEFLRNEKMNAMTGKKPLDSNPKPPALNEITNTNLNINECTGNNEDFLLNKVDMNIQTNLVSQTIDDLYTNCLSNEKLQASDDESDEDQRKLMQEQESLERQIRELENTEIDIDTETDETDCEAIIDLEDTESSAENVENLNSIGNTDEEMTLEMRYEAVLSDMTWVERVETLATLQALVARHPGRAQELHAKLSSPSRRRSLHETLKKYQAKQTRALEKRQALQKEKALKIQHLLARVEDVKAAKQQLIEDKRLRMEERLQRAAENRNQYLKDKIRKAHDEEEKLKEIAFIKNLEQQNKLLTFMESCKEQEVRLQDIEQERQKKAEEKAAKEAAVERRRIEIEQERQKRLEKMSQTRREREKRVGKMQEQKEKMRQEKALEKARDREERLLALQAQQLATTEELQRKIIQKQQESARRHEENIEHIRQRAVELTIPNRNAEEATSVTKSAADTTDLDDNLSVSDKGKENKSYNKKKVKKLRVKMKECADQYLDELQPLSPQIRRQSQVPKLLNTIIKGGGPVGVERPLGQLLRLIAKAEVVDFQSMWLLDGLKTISEIIQKGMEANSDVSKRAVVISVQLYRNACSLCPQISRHAILGNTISILLDSLVISLKTPEEKNPLFAVELSTELILACTVALSSTNSLKQTHPKLMQRLPDLLSYIVALGLLDTLSKKCFKVHEPVENQQSLILSLLASLGLLTKVTELCPKDSSSETIRFLATVKSTELFGSISLLYSTIVPIGECIPPRTISLAAATFNLLVTLANLDVNTFQEVLAGEYLSLKFLDVITILLKYCGPKSDEKGETQAVIIDLIRTLGFFCANNKNNQNLLMSEQSTVVIKSLTKLSKKFDMFIYPTFTSVCHQNPEAKQILSKDFDVESLEEYKKSDMAKKNTIVALLKEGT